MAERRGERMSEEYISREAALKSICEYCPEIGMCADANIHCTEYATLKAIPAADVAPVRHGYWIGTEYDGYADGNPVYTMFECSECGVEYEQEENYCPWCGAKMDG